MLHPFSGVTAGVPTNETEVTRRQVLGTMVFAAGAVAVPGLVRGQVAATDAINEAGRQPGITTLALGEEGAGLATKALNEAGGRTLPAVTTEPFGEEAGRVTSRVQPGLEDGANQPVLTQAIPEEGRATTLAIGEEGGPRPGVVTTEALNEEGAIRPFPKPLPVPLPPQREPGLSTQALGEEGGANAPKEVPQIAIAIAAVEIIAQEVPVQDQPIKQIQIQIQPLPPIQATTNALNEEAATAAALEAGVATTRAVGEEGAATRALNEGGINFGGVVNVLPMARELTEVQLKTAWEEMGSSDAGKGLQASAVLYGSKQSLTFLKAYLKFDMPKVDAAMVAKLIKDLDSDDFDIREKAELSLEKLGMAAATALQTALDSRDASMEVKMRAKRVLDKVKENSPIVRIERGAEVLVALNTPESKSLLETLASGAETDFATGAAKKALARGKN